MNAAVNQSLPWGAAREYGDEDRVDAGRRRGSRGDLEPGDRCTKVSAGCPCYAETFAERWRAFAAIISSTAST